EEVPELADVTLDMRLLSETDAAGIGPVLEPLVAGYETWIATQRSRIDDPAARLEEFGGEAESALLECEKTASRIRTGIELLVSEPKALDAFCFANRAMWQQRVRSLAASDRRRDSSLKVGSSDS